MNLNYTIFRSEPIMTIGDLAQIGSHNKREKKAYQSNLDINLKFTKKGKKVFQNIDIYSIMIMIRFQNA